MSEVIIFPTDTVYGIGTSLYDAEGIDRIYEIKHRDRSKPLPVLCASLEQIEEVAVVDSDSRTLIKSFLPGPLTLILPAKPKTAAALGIDSVGVRIPDCKIAIDLLEEKGPMATTSVNFSGELPLSNYEEIVDTFSADVEQIIKAEQKFSNLSSSVVEVKDNEVKVLREGKVTAKEIKEVLKKN